MRLGACIFRRRIGPFAVRIGGGSWYRFEWVCRNQACAQIIAGTTRWYVTAFGTVPEGVWVGLGDDGTWMGGGNRWV